MECVESLIPVKTNIESSILQETNIDSSILEEQTHFESSILEQTSTESLSLEETRTEPSIPERTNEDVIEFLSPVVPFDTSNVKIVGSEEASNREINLDWLDKILGDWSRGALELDAELVSMR